MSLFRHQRFYRKRLKELVTLIKRSSYFFDGLKDKKKHAKKERKKEMNSKQNGIVFELDIQIQFHAAPISLYTPITFVPLSLTFVVSSHSIVRPPSFSYARHSHSQAQHVLLYFFIRFETWLPPEPKKQNTFKCHA